MRYVLGCLICVTYPGMLVAQQSHVQALPSAVNPLQVGKMAVALPPGDWRVLNQREARVNMTSGPGSSTETKYLIRVNEKNQWVGAISVAATKHSGVVTDWTDSVCNRTDMLWIKQTDGNFKFPACLFINHSHPVWTNVPNNEFDKTIFDWYRVNKIELPKTALAVGYRKYFSGDYVTVRFDINPELVGFSPDTGNSRASSQWHPDLIKEDAGKVRYVDALQKWAETMEIPYRNSLRSGSPGDNTLGLCPQSR